MTFLDFAFFIFADLTHSLPLAYNKFVPESKTVGNQPDFKKEAFGGATQNWMNFQTTYTADETFKTTSATSFSDIGGRKDPFALKQTSLTAD